MKQKILFFSLALLATTFFGCDDDDPVFVPTEVQAAFTAKYPSAKNVEWENKGVYKVAEFYNNNLEMSAWFDSNGVWYMTETDLTLNQLPASVQNAFNASDYSAWKIDDVDMLERKDLDVIYIIEVESQNKEVDLYYNAEGILVKTSEDKNDSNNQNKLPQSTPTSIQIFINENYPQSRIVEIERENGQIEVDIIHDGKGKEVVFDLEYNWLYTSWEVRISALPQAVANVINKTGYAGYYIDDADFVETPQGIYYLLELEKGNSEIKIKVDESGNVL